MKKFRVLLSLVGATAIIVSLSSSADGPGRIHGILANGTPGAFNNNCNLCHSAAAGTTTVTGITLTDVATNTPVSGSYVPGRTYKVDILATNSAALPAYGFQVTVVDAANADAGAFAATMTNTGTATAEGHAVFEHRNRLNAATAGNYAPTFNWTAPAAGRGTLVLYAVLNAVNADGGFAGDQSSPSTAFTLTESNAADVDDVRTAADIAVYPNPAAEAVCIRAAKASGVVSLMDGAGRVVSQQSLVEGRGGVTVLSLSALPAGIYHIRLQQGESVHSRSFMKW